MTSNLAEQSASVQVGARLTGEEVDKVSIHMTKYGHICKLTTLEWLRKCSEQRRLLEVPKPLEVTDLQLRERLKQADGTHAKASFCRTCFLELASHVCAR